MSLGASMVAGLLVFLGYEIVRYYCRNIWYDGYIAGKLMERETWEKGQRAALWGEEGT